MHSYEQSPWTLSLNLRDHFLSLFLSFLKISPSPSSSLGIPLALRLEQLSLSFRATAVLDLYFLSGESNLERKWKK